VSGIDELLPKMAFSRAPSRPHGQVGRRFFLMAVLGQGCALRRAAAILAYGFESATMP